MDDNRRRWVLKQTKDEYVRAFWVKEFPSYGKQFTAEIVAPILNKLGAILASPAVREIVTRHRPYLDARRAMDRKGIVFIGPFLELLAEARKYGVTLVMATQSLAAMDEKVRRSMLTNIGTLVAFRSGADDVELLLKEFAGLFRPEILMALNVGECVVKEGTLRPRIVRLDPSAL